MKVELPQVGESVTEGDIGTWLKRVGDRVEKFEPLVEVITDKVNMEFPSPVSGVLTKILADEGQTVPMGSVIAEIAVEGESEEPVGDDEEAKPPGVPNVSGLDKIGTLLQDVAPVGPTGSGTGAVAQSPAVGSDAPSSIPTDPAQDPSNPAPAECAPPTRRRYSPAVRRLSDEHGIDLTFLRGTGNGGRVTLQDVRNILDGRAVSEAPGPASQASPQAADLPPAVRPLTPVRRMVAANMTKSATLIPQAWTLVEVDVTGLVELREHIKEDVREQTGVSLTYLPFAIHAVAEALRDHPLVNSTWTNEGIGLYQAINIGIAVATEEGLMVPVIHGAAARTIIDLARSLNDLTARAREGRLSLVEVHDGTFTVNNTGALGSVVSQPLINHPQAAIMTTEAIVKRPAIVNETVAIRSLMNICLTFDHRIMDGAEAGAFLADVKSRLESVGLETPLD